MHFNKVEEVTDINIPVRCPNQQYNHWYTLLSLPLLHALTSAKRSTKQLWEESFYTL